MSKICNTCDLIKSLEDFHKNKAGKDGHSGKCKECQRAYDADFYRRNRDKYLGPSKDRAREARRNNKQFLLEYLSSHPCVDCGNADIRVLQFDHREAVNGKRVRVTNFLNSRRLMTEEIAKCDVRCANCHMIRTAEQFGWVRNLEGHP